MNTNRKRIVATTMLALVTFSVVLGFNMYRNGNNQEQITLEQIAQASIAQATVAPAPIPTINPADEPARLEAARRFLRASQYLLTLKNMLQQSMNIVAQQQQASAPAVAHPLQSVDDKTFEALAAPVFARHLTLLQAQEIANFYESDAGQFFVKQSQPGAPAVPDVNDALQHSASIEKFLRSESGSALQVIAGDQDVVRAVFKAVADKAKGS